MVSKYCWNCGKPIKANPSTQHQKFCSVKCRNEYSRLKKTTTFFEPFSFYCSQCGHQVIVEDPNDKRTRFCCKECEKKYWKHPPYENTTSRTNFHSIEEYMSWERRTNGGDIDETL